MSTPAADLGIVLNLAFATFRSELDADLERAGFAGIGGSFGYVFRRLDEGPCSLSDLAKGLGMTAPGALKVIDDMEAKGYVERKADAVDRRVKLLSLTPRGTAALAHARGFHKKFEERLVKRLGPSKVAAMREVLEAIVAADSSDPIRRARPV